MGQLDASIVTVALPTLQRTFHASVGAVTWVGLSYLLVLVATVTAVGRFADMWGRKLLYIYGFAIFVIGSALCGLAPSLGVLIAFRVLQAIGAAMLQANSVAIIVLAVPRASLGKAIGIQGAAQAVGLALGPSVGGLLLAAGGWRLIFMVNVPFGVLGVIAGLLLIPRSLHLGDRVPFDWKGLSLFFPAIVAVLSAISFGNSYGWTSPSSWGRSPSDSSWPLPSCTGSDASRPDARSLALCPLTVPLGYHQWAPVVLGHVRRSLPRPLLFRAGVGNRRGARRARAHDDAARTRGRRSVRRSPG